MTNNKKVNEIIEIISEMIINYLEIREKNQCEDAEEKLQAV